MNALRKEKNFTSQTYIHKITYLSSYIEHGSVPFAVDNGKYKEFHFDEKPEYIYFLQHHYDYCWMNKCKTPGQLNNNFKTIEWNEMGEKYDSLLFDFPQFRVDYYPLNAVSTLYNDNIMHYSFDWTPMQSGDFYYRTKPYLGSY